MRLYPGPRSAEQSRRSFCTEDFFD